MAADTLAGIDIKPLAVRDPFNLRPNYSDEIGNVRPRCYQIDVGKQLVAKWEAGKLKPDCGVPSHPRG